MIYDLDIVRLARQAKETMFVESHAHKYYHYICVLGGEGVVTISSCEYHFSGKCFVLIAPEQIHSVRGNNGYFSIDIKFRCSDELMQELNLLEVPFPIISNVDDSHFTLVQEMVHEAILSSGNYRNLINAKLLTLLCLLGRSTSSELGFGTASDSTPMISHKHTRAVIDSEQIRPALDYINANLSKAISILELAELCGYTSTYFSSLFKEITGVSAVQYITNKKIELATTLMLSSNLSITEISDRIGYNSIHYFSKVFKKNLGIAPTKYLERINANVGITFSSLNDKIQDNISFPYEPVVPHSVELDIDAK